MHIDTLGKVDSIFIENSFNRKIDSILIEASLSIPELVSANVNGAKVESYLKQSINYKSLW